MILTDIQSKEFEDISNEDVQKDLKDTQIELKNFEDEHEVLSRNYQQNRVRLYFLEGNISQRKELIETLQCIIDYRRKNVPEIF